MNECIFTGRATKDAGISATNTGKQLAKFTIAVTRNFKNQSTGEYETDFFNCIAWNAAEYCGKYVKKGTYIEVVGEMQNRSYVGNDGSKKYVTELIVSRVKALKQSSTSSGQEEDTGEPIPPPENPPELQPIEDENLPF